MKKSLVALTVFSVLTAAVMVMIMVSNVETAKVMPHQENFQPEGINAVPTQWHPGWQHIVARDDYTGLGGDAEGERLGAHKNLYWDDINPSNGVYDWTELDDYLSAVEGMTVTLASGDVVSRPVWITLPVFWTQGTNGDCNNNVPAWLKTSAPDHVITPYTPTPAATTNPQNVPALDDIDLRSAYSDTVEALATHLATLTPSLKSHVAGFFISGGYDTETQVYAPYCRVTAATSNIDSVISATEYWDFISYAVDAFHVNLPEYPVFILSAPMRGSQRCDIEATVVAYPTPHMGFGFNGMSSDIPAISVAPTPNSDTGCGSFDVQLRNVGLIPLKFEPARAAVDDQIMYWSWLLAAAAGNDMVDIQDGWFDSTQFSRFQTIYGFPDSFYNFALRQLANNTPGGASDAWVAFRETEYPEFGTGYNQYRCSGYCMGWQGDFTRYLAIKSGATTLRCSIYGMETCQDTGLPTHTGTWPFGYSTDPYSRQSRRLDETVTLEISPTFQFYGTTQDVYLRLAWLGTGTDPISVTFPVSGGSDSVSVSRVNDGVWHWTSALLDDMVVSNSLDSDGVLDISYTGAKPTLHMVWLDFNGPTTPVPTSTPTPTPTPWLRPTSVALNTSPEAARCQPVIECSSTSSCLVVWQDKRNDPGSLWTCGYGLTNNGDIYGAIVDPTTSAVITDDIVIRNTARDEQYPAVHFGPNGEYLVAWQKVSDSATTANWNSFEYCYDIEAQRVDVDGSLEGSVVTVSNAVDCQWDPQIASTDDDFLVTWHDHRYREGMPRTPNPETQKEIFGQWIDATAGTLSGSNFVLSASSTVGTPTPAARYQQYNNITTIDNVVYSVWGDLRDVTGTAEYYDLYQTSVISGAVVPITNTLFHDPDTGVAEKPRIAADAADGLWTTWQRFDNPTPTPYPGEMLVYADRTLTDTTRSFTAPIVVMSSTQTLALPDVACTNNGVCSVVFANSALYDVMVKRYALWGMELESGNVWEGDGFFQGVRIAAVDDWFNAVFAKDGYVYLASWQETVDQPTPVAYTATPTRTPRHPGGGTNSDEDRILCPYKTDIDVDGDIGEWGVGYYIDISRTTADMVRSEDDSVVQSDDLSARVWCAWKADKLYMAARVRDDSLVGDSLTRPWEDDGVEFGFDTADDGIPWGPDDHEWHFRATDGEINYFNRFPTSETGSGLAFERTIADGYYIIEASITNDAFERRAIAAGDVYGFTAGLTDDDDGRSSDAEMLWRGDNPFDVSSGWGEMELISGDYEATNTPTPPPGSPQATETPGGLVTGTATSTPSGLSTVTPSPTVTPTPTATLPVCGAVGTSTPTPTGTPPTPTPTWTPVFITGNESGPPGDWDGSYIATDPVFPYWLSMSISLSGISSEGSNSYLFDDPGAVYLCSNYPVCSTYNWVGAGDAWIRKNIGAYPYWRTVFDFRANDYPMWPPATPQAGTLQAGIVTWARNYVADEYDTTMDLYLCDDGGLSASGYSPFATCSGTIAKNTWTEIDIEYLSDPDGAGWYVIRLDGTAVITDTAGDLGWVADADTLLLGVTYGNGMNDASDYRFDNVKVWTAATPPAIPPELWTPTPTPPCRTPTPTPTPTATP